MRRIFGTFRRTAFRRRTLLYAAMAAFFAVVVFGGLRTSLGVNVAYAQNQQRVDEPVHLMLNQNLGDVNVDEISISPHADGTWQHNRGLLIGGDELIFQPSGTLRVATEYNVKFPVASRLLVGSAEIPEITFETEDAPRPIDQGLAALEDGEVIAADEPLSITLGGKNRGLRELVLKTTPKIELKREVTDDQNYSWVYDGVLPQAKQVRFELYDEKNDEVLLERTVNVASEPRVTSFVKAAYFSSQDTAIIVFDQAITPDSEKYISFEIDGEGKWRDERSYEFRPTDIQPGKSYRYQINKGLRTKNGGILTKSLSRQFATTGSVQVTASGPWGDGLAQARQTIYFRFDQPVIRSSAESRLSVSRGKIVSTSWTGNQLDVLVQSIGYQQTVSARVAAGVKNAGFGLPSSQAYSVRFTTEVRSKKLAVPFYAQQSAASCAVASLRMALAYRGISASESTIVNRMGYQPTDMDKSKDPPVWDDPQKMYVGHIGGSIRAGTGAGPDAPPVAKASVSLGRNASAVRGISAGWIAKQIYAGNPVIMFGATRDTGFITWKNRTGGTAKMNLTSHATVVYGVAGEPDRPVGFWVHDPLGSSSYWSLGAVETNIARDAYQQAVVVY